MAYPLNLVIDDLEQLTTLTIRLAGRMNLDVTDLAEHPVGNTGSIPGDHIAVTRRLLELIKAEVA